MKKVVLMRQTFANYQSIVMIHRNKDGVAHMAHSFLYHGRDNINNMLFLYKDPLPAGSFIEAWNELDDNSINTNIVPEESHERGIDDFLACWDSSLIDAPVELIEVEDFGEIDRLMKQKEINKQELIFFARK